MVDEHLRQVVQPGNLCHLEPAEGVGNCRVCDHGRSTLPVEVALGDARHTGGLGGQHWNLEAVAFGLLLPRVFERPGLRLLGEPGVVGRHHVGQDVAQALGALPRLRPGHGVVRGGDDHSAFPSSQFAVVAWVDDLRLYRVAHAAEGTDEDEASATLQEGGHLFEHHCVGGDFFDQAKGRVDQVAVGVVFWHATLSAAQAAERFARQADGHQFNLVQLVTRDIAD